MSAKRKIPPEAEAAIRAGLGALAGVAKRAAASMLSSAARDVQRATKEVQRRAAKFQKGLHEIIDVEGEDVSDEDEWKPPRS